MRTKNRKLKILMVTPYLPYPPHSGGQTRSFNLIKHLSKNCEITLFSFLLPSQREEGVKELEKYCREVFLISRGKTWDFKKIIFTGITPYPLLVSNYYSRPLKRMIKKTIKTKEYDLIHIECFYLMPNIPKVNIPVILVDQTIEFAVYKHFVETLSWKYFLLKPFLWLDVFKIKFWEIYFWKKADKLLAVSEKDQKLMEKLSRRKVEVVPNGVGEEFFQRVDIIKKYKNPTILYGVANFNWIQNKEGSENLIKYVWPKIKKTIPNAKLIIAGRNSRKFIFSKFHQDRLKDIKICEVKDPKKTYWRSWVLVAPMRSGGGSRTKFFEAMASGLPIVTTPEGIEGIEARHKQEVLISDNFNSLAQLAIRVLKDPSLRKTIGENGRKLVMEKYNWKVSAKQLLKIYQKIVANGKTN